MLKRLKSYKDYANELLTPRVIKTVVQSFSQQAARLGLADLGWEGNYGNTIARGEKPSLTVCVSCANGSADQSAVPGKFATTNRQRVAVSGPRQILQKHACGTKLDVLRGRSNATK